MFAPLSKDFPVTSTQLPVSPDIFGSVSVYTAPAVIAAADDSMVSSLLSGAAQPVTARTKQRGMRFFKAGLLSPWLRVVFSPEEA
jgi:hypothetical protein